MPLVLASDRSWATVGCPEAVDLDAVFLAGARRRGVDSGASGTFVADDSAAFGAEADADDPGFS